MENRVEGVIGRGSTCPSKSELMEMVRQRSSKGAPTMFILDSFEPHITIENLKKYIKGKLNGYCSNLKITVQIREIDDEKNIAIHVVFDSDKASVFSRHIKSVNTMVESNTEFKAATLKAVLHSRLKLLGSSVKENEYLVSDGTISVKLDTTKVLRSMLKKSNTEFEYRVDPFENITIID